MRRRTNVEQSDLWILTYLIALQKDKLRPEYEAALACEHFGSWVDASWEAYEDTETDE